MPLHTYFTVFLIYCKWLMLVSDAASSVTEITAWKKKKILQLILYQFYYMNSFHYLIWFNIEVRNLKYNDRFVHDVAILVADF